MASGQSDAPVLKARIVELFPSDVQETDSGSGADKNLILLLPRGYGDGWFALGQVAMSPKKELQPGYSVGYALVVKEINPGSGVLADVSSWEKVWDNHGTRKNEEFSLWRGVASDPSKYEVLSDYFKRGERGEAPSKWATGMFTAVSKSCLVEGEVGDMIWSDKGSRATEDGSVWEIKSDGSGIPMINSLPHFVSVKSADKPTRPVYVIKGSALSFAP